MHKLAGLGVSAGVAVGPVLVVDRALEVRERHIAPDEVGAELARLDAALAEADTQMARIQRQIAEKAGEEHSAIIEAHRMMLADASLLDEARRLVRDEHAAAEWAAQRALARARAVFDEVEDPYFRDRGTDVGRVGQRLLRILVGQGDVTGVELAVKGAVVVAHDLAPADVAQYARLGAVAFCTEVGGRSSHTAIVARALGLPYVVGVRDLARHLVPGLPVVVDGQYGEVVAEPDEETLRLCRGRAEEAVVRTERLAAGRQGPCRTRDGTAVTLDANVEILDELPVARAAGAESVGLFRTEFLFLGRPDLPGEDEQFEHAAAALRHMQGRTVTFRTLDLGGDKLPASVRLPLGVNPALGLRSIRFSLLRRDVFRSQLRALYRASALGPLRIMFPLISGVAELREAQAVCADVRLALDRDGIPFSRQVPIGVMVETPSAALIADLLAAECDFLSIGTNDLIQYALAADRDDDSVGYLYRPLHPAILRAVRFVVTAGEQAGRPVAMCGDMAGDPAYTLVLLGLGLRTFSMAARQIPVVDSVIRGTSLDEARALSDRVMAARTEVETEQVVNEVMRARFPFELSEDGRRPDGG